MIKYVFSSVQSLSRVQPFATPWITARQASLSITNSWSLLKLMSIESCDPIKCVSVWVYTQYVPVSIYREKVPKG